MCVGQTKNDFLKQVFVNRSLVRLSGHVNAKLDDKDEGASKKYAEMDMHQALKREEIRIKLQQQLMIDHAKYDDTSFDESGNEISGERKYDQFSVDTRSYKHEARNTTGHARPYSSPLIQNSSQMMRHSQSTVSAFEKYTFDKERINEFIEENVQKIMENITFESELY